MKPVEQSVTSMPTTGENVQTLCPVVCITPRTTTVTVGITRLLNTAQYENLEVTLHTTDEVTWGTNTERDMKIANLTTLLTKKYAETQSQVLADLGVEEKRAWIKANRNPQTTGQTTRSSVGDELLD